MKFLQLFTSRKFLAALIGLGLIIAQAYGKMFDADQLTGMLVILAGYIGGLAFDPGLGHQKLLETLASKKFWTAIIGVVGIGTDFFGAQIPISSEAMLQIAGVIGTLIVAMGYADQQKVDWLDAEVEKKIAEDEIDPIYD